MRKLLNTIYVTNELMYLTLDGENLVCKIDGETKLRIPFENIENIENAIRVPDDFVNELNCIHYVYNHPVLRNTLAH